MQQESRHANTKILIAVYLIIFVQMEVRVQVSCCAYRMQTCVAVLPSRRWSDGLCLPVWSCWSSASMTSTQRPH